MNTKHLLCSAVLLGLSLSVALRAADAPAENTPPKKAAAVSPASVRQIKVQPDKAPDCSSLKTIVDTITRDCKTNDDKAVAVYNFMQLAHYHLTYANEKNGLGALQEINVYGWGICGGLHAVQASLWRELGWKWRFVGWPGHTTNEAFYDNRWHYFDTFLKIYLWMPEPNSPNGRTIAGEADIAQNPNLVMENLVYDPKREVYYEKNNAFEIISGKANWQTQAFLCCKDGPKGVVEGCKARKEAGSPTTWMYNFDSDPSYSTDVNLTPDTSLTLLWHAIENAQWYGCNLKRKFPEHTCGDRDVRNSPTVGLIMEPYLPAPLNAGKRTFCSGLLAFNPDFSSDAFLKGLVAKENVQLKDGQLVPVDAALPASVTFELKSPYVMSKATGVADGADKVELSVDSGKTFKPIQIADYSDAVAGSYACQIKVSFKAALKTLKTEIIIQHNRGAAPYLSPGKNTISVTLADPKELGDNKLLITYAYNTGFRTKTFEALAESEENIARGKSAQWATEPTLVQKVFTAKDLPATFEIDIPTPKNQQPIYPRMLFLRREVIAANSKPLPLPENAIAAKMGENDELKTLPNPFLIGTVLPPVKIVRPVTTKKFELKLSHVVSEDGKVEANHYLKTKKDEHWVALVCGELPTLPNVAEIAAVRLIVPVTNTVEKGSTRMIATLLKAPIEAEKAFDFKMLGAKIGTVVLPPQTAPSHPAKPFALEITTSIKTLLKSNGKFMGFSLQTEPDRTVDEGYTVRVHLAAEPKIVLEIDVFEAEQK